MALILSGDTGVPASGMPTGSVIQTVNASTATTVSLSSSTYTDTTLTATITPLFANSKIVVVINQSGCYKDGSAQNGGALRLVRNGTTLINMAGRFAGDNTIVMSIGSISTSYLDSPATTSALTYKTQFSSESNAATVYVQVYQAVSTITLMEIKQ